MKNPTTPQLDALAARAKSIAALLPPLLRGADGRLDAPSREAFSAAAQSVLRQNRAVGASLVLRLADGAQETFCFGHARLRPRMQVTRSTCFRIASVSKLAMTFGALSLRESGQLDLDADITDFLGYPVRSPHAPDIPVTMRMLLTHTSAIRDEGNYGTRGMEAGCTLRELLDAPVNWTTSAPGEAFHYSNLGAGVAGVVMERAAVQPFEAIMQERVFAPMGMRASYDPARISPAGDLADGYSVRCLLPPLKKYDAASLCARPPQAFHPETDFLIAAGRMITDSDGMGRLLSLLASKGDTPALSSASLALMRAPQDGRHGIAPLERGLNVAFLPDVFPGFSPVGHQGVAYGMCAECFADPDTGCGVGLMTSGAQLSPAPPLMRVGFDLLALSFASFR